MIHMVFMKFEDGFFCDEIRDKIADTFRVLSREMPDEIFEAEVLTNCVERETNMDLLIRMSLKDEDSLPKYLHHPAHIAIGVEINPHIVNRCSFDYEE